jgi:hypothetical protein
MHNYTGQKVRLVVEQFSFNEDRFVAAGTEGAIHGQYSEEVKVNGKLLPRMFAVSFPGISAALLVPVEFVKLL